jgi:nucleotide-binding universal stress UspA family protein
LSLRQANAFGKGHGAEWEASMLKTILVPTDGSAHAKKAVDLAGDLAATSGAKIVLLHVLLRGHMPEGLMRAAQVEHIGESHDKPSNLVNIPQEIMARVEGKMGTQLPLQVLEFIGKRVLAGAEQVCRDKGVETVELVVEEGRPTEIILDYAKRTNADMIVMGSRGLSALKGILMGSISSQVSQLADCTCVTVK